MNCTKKVVFSNCFLEFLILLLVKNHSTIGTSCILKKKQSSGQMETLVVPVTKVYHNNM